MCIFILALKFFASHPLLIINNRDEVVHRKTTPLKRWLYKDHVVYSGRDQVHGGTWFVMSESGRVAIMTNYRTYVVNEGSETRGFLVLDFVVGDVEPLVYLEGVKTMKDLYDPFNIVVGCGDEFYYYNNYPLDCEVMRLDVGRIYGCSNGVIDEWEKVTLGKNLLGESDPSDVEGLFKILANKEQPDDEHLQVTDHSPERERPLSSIFCSRHAEFGTRTSTVLSIDQEQNGIISERTFEEDDVPVVTRTESFRIQQINLNLS